MHDLLATEDDIKRLQQIVGKSVYIYPRLHNSLSLLVKEIYLRPSTSKLRTKLIKQITQIIFDEWFFNENVY